MPKRVPLKFKLQRVDHQLAHILGQVSDVVDLDSLVKKSTSVKSLLLGLKAFSTVVSVLPPEEAKAQLKTRRKLRSDLKAISESGFAIEK